MKPATTLPSILLPLLALASARAESLAIINHDFETGGLAGDGFTHSPGVIPAGWTAIGSTTGDFFGYWNTIDGAYPGTAGNATIAGMSGPNVFYFGSLTDGEGIGQTLSATFASFTTYTLTIALGARNESLAFTASLDTRLLAGSTVIAENTFRNTANNGTFADFDLIYAYNAAHAGLVGQPLTIQLVENNDVALPELDIDNIRLVATPIPEPASAALLVGLAAAALAVSPRRRPAGHP